MPSLEEYVLGLDVAVYDATAVRVAQRPRHLSCDLQRLVHTQALLATQPIAQRFTLDVRHHVVEKSAGLARVVKGQDMGMGELRRDGNLSQEARCSDAQCQVGVKDLERDFSLVLQVLGE